VEGWLLGVLLGLRDWFSPAWWVKGCFFGGVSFCPEKYVSLIS
jgi:hypothetical protein